MRRIVVVPTALLTPEAIPLRTPPPEDATTPEPPAPEPRPPQGARTEPPQSDGDPLRQLIEDALDQERGHGRWKRLNGSGLTGA